MVRVTSSPLAPPWRVAAAGMLALAVAMGIGRFAFTPLLPMMLADGTVTLPVASWLASANYLGYLVGALLCTVQPWLWQRRGRPPLAAPPMIRIGLAATVLLTLGMALHWPGAWPLLRFAAGVASALVFVYASSWCLGQLARRGVPEMGALIYTGPGAGIVLSGLAATAMVAAHWTAAFGWLMFGVLAAALSAVCWPVVSTRNELPAPSPAQATAAHAPVHGPAEVTLLALGYGIAGFGYIITATFLPVIARQSLPGSPWLDMFWPIFGAGVVGGALIASRIRASGDLRVVLAGCYALQAFGVSVGLWSPTLAGFALGSLLAGLPFTAITYFAMQEARRLRPVAPSALMSMITAVYGLGQIAGPPVTALLLARSATPAAGFDHALEFAAGSLVLGAMVFVGMSRAWPRHRT